MTTLQPPPRLTVVIPCYRVRAQVLDVLARMPLVVQSVICVDDCCPDGSGTFIEESVRDPRVRVIRNTENLGVGGATMAGYRAALAAGAEVVIKVDGDGQMDPLLIPALVRPILQGAADYAKGNRFYDIDSVAAMPKTRLVGNAILTFFAKISTGYWRLFDPTNGFTAIHASALARLPLDKIAPRYFFESDMLFRLNTVRAVVMDVPMKAVYGSEQSNLRVSGVIGPFLWGHTRNALRRFFYNYLLRDFSIASVELLVGTPALIFGVLFGAREWHLSLASGIPASAGTVMVSALPLIVGLQLVLSALSYDIGNAPVSPLQQGLEGIEHPPLSPGDGPASS